MTLEKAKLYRTAWHYDGITNRCLRVTSPCMMPNGHILFKCYKADGTLLGGFKENELTDFCL